MFELVFQTFFLFSLKFCKLSLQALSLPGGCDCTGTDLQQTKAVEGCDLMTRLCRRTGLLHEYKYGVNAGEGDEENE